MALPPSWADWLKQKTDENIKTNTSGDVTAQLERDNFYKFAEKLDPLPYVLELQKIINNDVSHLNEVLRQLIALVDQKADSNTTAISNKISQADGDNRYAKLAGDQSRTFSVATPTLDNHAATKGYADEIKAGHAASQPHGIFYLAADQSGKNQGSGYIPKLHEHHARNEMKMVQAINGNQDIKAILIPEDGYYDTYCSIRTGNISESQISLYFLKGRTQASSNDELLKWDIVEHSGVSDAGKAFSKMETVAVLPLRKGDMVIPTVSMYRSDIILEDYSIGVEVGGSVTNIVIQSGMELNIRKLYGLADEITLQLHGTITKNASTGNYEAVNIDASLIPQDAKDEPSRWRVVGVPVISGAT